MLTPCLYCGVEISSNATVCPKCEAKKPLGEVCAYCQRFGRRDEFEELRVSSIPLTTYSHDECLERYFTVPADVKCPDCHTVLAGKISTRSIVGDDPKVKVCPQCGNRNLFYPHYRCVDCGVPIYQELAQRRVMISEGTHYSDATWGHSFCRSAQALPKKTVWSTPGCLARLLVLLLVLAAAIMFFTPAWAHTTLLVLVLGSAAVLLLFWLIMSFA